VTFCSPPIALSRKAERPNTDLAVTNKFSGKSHLGRALPMRQ
jgi:hypothetical protein